MIVYLIRHGSAEDRAASGLDRDRCLTDHGRTRILKTGRALHRLGVNPNRILTSPYPRAAETAKLIARMLGATERVEEVAALACGGGAPQQVRAWLKPEHSEVIIVGHNPEMAEIAAALAGAGTQLHFKKGSVCRIELPDPRALGTLTWLLPPKVLIAIGDEEIN